MRAIFSRRWSQSSQKLNKVPPPRPSTTLKKKHISPLWSGESRARERLLIVFFCWMQESATFSCNGAVMKPIQNDWTSSLTGCVKGEQRWFIVLCHKELLVQSNCFTPRVNTWSVLKGPAVQVSSSHNILTCNWAVYSSLKFAEFY